MPFGAYNLRIIQYCDVLHQVNYPGASDRSPAILAILDYVPYLLACASMGAYLGEDSLTRISTYQYTYLVYVSERPH